MTGPVSPTLAGLEVEWFAGALELPVSGVEVVAVAFAGATTDLARVRLTYAGDTPGPTSVIAKITGRDEVRAAMDAAMGLFAREARFYATFAQHVPVRAPRCFYVGDGDTTPLLLEDLADLRMGDQMDGLTVPDAERIIDALAGLHAGYWQAEALEQEWLLDPAGGAFAGMVAHLVASGSDALRDRFEGRVPPVTLRAVLDHAPDWQSVLARGAEGPRTLVHYDARSDNIFYAPDGTPVFIDWQAIASARGTHDIALLLTQSMDMHMLREHWESLLRRYHARLLDSGVSDYRWDACVRHYRQNVLYSVGAGMALLGAMDIGDGRGLGDVIVTRALHHAHDVDAFGAL
jgi:hypothetical protein